jgi:hypothetical protein
MLLTLSSLLSTATPVKVFIMMGQSNMLGEGKIGPVTTNGTLEYAVTTEKLYPYMVDATGKFKTSASVRNVFTMGSGGPTSKPTIESNEFLTAGAESTGKAKSTLGPELGIGWMLDAASSDPQMMLKTCIGNRALGWDLLPPTQKQYDFVRDVKGVNTTYTYAGYHDSPASWVKGTTPKPISWYAGVQYDGDTQRAEWILGNLTTYYPSATSYEVAGFFWWQGDRDSRDKGLSTRYEQNLVALIKVLRARFKAPNAPFVTASLGQTVSGSTDGGGDVLDAMQNVACNAAGSDPSKQPAGHCKYPEFKGTVSWVYANPLMVTKSSSGSHYSGDARTYMNIGQAMGSAMVKLLQH